MAKPKITADTKLSDLFDDDLSFEHVFVPTGVRLVDPALGGGIPKGVLGEVFGPTGSGKTSLMYAHMAQQQKLGNVSVLFDAEGSWNPGMGARYGIDVAHVNEAGNQTFLKSSKPEIKVVESLFAAIKTILYNRHDVTFILVDSLAALTSSKSTERKEGDQTNTDAMQRANVLSVYMRDLVRWIADNDDRCTVVFINHEKQVIGMTGHGPPKTDTGGGVALKFYSTFRLQFKHVKTDNVKVFDPVTKQEATKADKLYIRVQAVKNRAAVPFVPATFIFDVGGGTGIDVHTTALAHAVAQKAIKAGGGGNYTLLPAFTATGEEVKLKGKEAVRSYYAENVEAFEKLESHLAANLSQSKEVVISEDDDDGEEITVDSIKI